MTKTSEPLPEIIPSTKDMWEYFQDEDYRAEMGDGGEETTLNK